MRTFIGIAVFSLLVFPMSCRHEGPLERAGRNADEGVRKMDRAIEDAGESAADTIEDATDDDDA